MKGDHIQLNWIYVLRKRRILRKIEEWVIDFDKTIVRRNQSKNLKRKFECRQIIFWIRQKTRGFIRVFWVRIYDRIFKNQCEQESDKNFIWYYWYQQKKWGHLVII
jgi:hypothetical protein